MLTQEKLKKIINYDPETGSITRIINVKDIEKAGAINTNGHRQIRIGKKLYLAHRLAFIYMTGIFPKYEVDHINGMRDDNRWCNLRDVSHTNNMRNTKNRVDNVSGITGVSRRAKQAAWRVNIINDGKQMQKSFSDSKYGGNNLAFMAASFCSVRLRQELGYHENHGRV